jgi:hypothetical protein
LWRCPLKRGRQKRERRKPGSNKDIFAVIEVYPAGESVRFIFGSDFIPQNPLTKVKRTIGPYSFVTSVLPAASFRLHLTMDTLAVR